MKNRKTQTSVDSIHFTKKQAQDWRLPEFQREDTVNGNVLSLVERLKADGGVLPGIITFGVVDGVKYLIDGRQRRNAFLLSELAEGYVDVRTCYLDSMADLAEEFISLNSHLVVMKPDDIMRGLEPCLPVLQMIRKACPFVGYGQIRREGAATLLSMSSLIRCWSTSAPPVPGSRSTSGTALARQLSTEEGEHAVRFLNCCFKAWGTDPEYFRLWGALNLTLCAWLYRRIVLTKYSAKTQKINDAQFTKCLMSLSASPTYVDWCVGRKLGERDRSPAYGRLKAIFTKRLIADGCEKPLLPAPPWSHNSSSRALVH